MKVKHRLLNFNNKYIYQDDEWFNFSLDSVLLANFVTIRKKDKKIMDFCTGNAAVLMLLSYRTNAKLVGVEVQKCVYDLGVQSILENSFDKQIELINDDVKNISSYYKQGEFDVVICNPPYFRHTSDKFINDNYVKCVARHEILITLDDVIAKACYLLNNDGIFAMVHQADRLIEIINIMQKYRIEPKKVQFVYSKYGSTCNLILIEGVKNGKSGLKILDPLYVHNDDGSYTDRVRDMFQE